MITNKFIPAIIFLLTLFTSLIVNANRIKYSINSDWQFYLNKTKENISSIPHKDFISINLPHTWNKNDAFEKSSSYFRGEGIYKKKIHIPKSYSSKKIFIHFEGANQVVDLYLNNKFIGNHIGGYTAFSFELTPDFKFGDYNELRVIVNNEHNENIPPLDADFTFYGGIYRDVYLIAADDIHFDLLDYASDGIYITPQRSTSGWHVKVSSEIVNQADINSDIKIIHTILNQKGNNLYQIASESEIFINSKLSETAYFENLTNINTWSPENPVLYYLRSEIYSGGILKDDLIIPFGFREIDYSPESGLMLNGEPIKLYGANRHQDFEGIGNVLTDQHHINDLKLIKGNGFNFLRLAHYPQAPLVLNTADRLGLIIWEEIPIINTISLTNEFTQSCRSMLIEMVKQHYNHPSIFMWGYMNEILLRLPNPMPANYKKAVYLLALELEHLVKELDPHRFTVLAQSLGEIDDGSGIGDITDMIGFNLYFGWYYDTFDDLTGFLDKYRSKNPDRAIIISEYGAGSDERIHSKAPESFDFSTEYQQLYHESQFSQILNNNYLVGSAIWNMYDFGSNSRNDTKFGINQKGIYYFDRTPKDISYYYKSHLDDKPLIYIASRDHKKRSIALNDLQKLKIYSNLDEVTLTVNDQILEKKELSNNTAEWNIKLNAGENQIEVIGYCSDKKITDKITLTAVEQRPDFSNQAFSINVGAHFDYIDETGNIWIADDGSNNKIFNFDGGNRSFIKHRIYETVDDPIFQTRLIDINGFTINLPQGVYKVMLLFAEYESISILNQIKIMVNDSANYFVEIDKSKNFTAHEITFEHFCNHNEKLNIKFESNIDRTFLNGISFIKLN